MVGRYIPDGLYLPAPYGFPIHTVRAFSFGDVVFTSRYIPYGTVISPHFERHLTCQPYGIPK